MVMGKFFLYILVLVLLEVSCKEEKIYRPDIVADLSVQIIPAEESLTSLKDTLKKHLQVNK